MESRYEELDSLRGLAALSVFFSHMLLIFNGSLIFTLLFEYGPLRFMVAGSEAVTLFFVLSGFVLSLSFNKGQKFGYAIYALKRVFRIYIPYFVAIMVSLLFWNMFYSGNIASLSDWFNINWSLSFNLNTLLDHLLLIGSFTSNLNNVVWSLVHEMRISLIFPLIMWVVVKTNIKKTIIIGIMLSVLSVIYATIMNASFVGTELYSTIHYSSIFILGAALAKYRFIISNKLMALQKKWKLVLFFVGIILYLYVHPSFVLNVVFHGFDPYYRMVIDSWFTSFGAGILLVFAISSPRFTKLLRNRVLIFIGRISYSFYLIHLAVLFSCIHFLHGQLPMWVILLLVTAVTFILSSFMYYLIEKPSIKLVSVITRALKAKKQNTTNTVKVT